MSIKLTDKLISQFDSICANDASRGVLQFIYTLKTDNEDTRICATNGHIMVVMDVTTDSLTTAILHDKLYQYDHETGTYFLTAKNRKRLNAYTPDYLSSGYPDISKIIPVFHPVNAPVQKAFNPKYLQVIVTIMQEITGRKKELGVRFTHDSDSEKTASCIVTPEMLILLMPLIFEYYDDILPAHEIYDFIPEVENEPLPA
jgi:hypothetical protein